jgi:surfeit locus 1 family protein
VKRVYVFAALALALAVLFVRLGVWQLHRLQERRARNAVVAARLAAPGVPIEQLLDSGETYRRAIVRGAPDYDHEIIVTGRSHDGSPGVDIVTPVRLPGGGAVLVNRGWVYAPDAATADVARWREATDSFAGYVDTLRTSTVASDTARGRKVRTLSERNVRALVPYAVSSRYVIVTEGGTDSTPARFASPVLDDGPHLSYAIQWFAFATIAVVGAGIVVARTRRESSVTEPPARGLL